MALVTVFLTLSFVATVNPFRLPREDTETNAVPSVIIFGIGDSGTRGVKGAMQKLGVHMCHQTNDSEDNNNTMRTHKYIKDLLAASGGAVGQKEGYMKSKTWKEAVQTELAGAIETRECAIQDAGLRADSVPTDFKWGYKNPRHAYLMPVMDAAFNGQQQMVAVARDFRDLCSGDNKGQFHSFADDVKDVEIDTRKMWRSLNLDAGDVEFDEEHYNFTKCINFVTAVWASVLKEYRDNQNFHIVRIEDLVTQTNKSNAVLSKLMDRVQLRPDSDAVTKQLETFHKYEHSYMGHGRPNKGELEREVATYAGTVHQIMQELGYDTDRYGLTEAKHPRVIQSK